MIVHGSTGYIAEIGDVERMAKYVIELLTNNGRYELFASTSRQRAVDLFGRDKVVNQYEQYYERVLSERSSFVK